MNILNKLLFSFVLFPWGVFLRLKLLSQRARKVLQLLFQIIKQLSEILIPFIMVAAYPYLSSQTPANFVQFTFKTQISFPQSARQASENLLPHLPVSTPAAEFSLLPTSKETRERSKSAVFSVGEGHQITQPSRLVQVFVWYGLAE